jgi:hypothetical protein
MTDKTTEPVCVNGCTTKDAADNLTPRRAAEGLLCRRCANNLKRWLRDIPVDYALLPMVLIPGSSAQQDGSSRTKQPEAPAPLNLTAAALMESRSDANPSVVGGDNGMASVARDPGDELWYELPDIPRALPILQTWDDQLRVDLDSSRDQSQPQLKPIAANVAGEVNYLLGAFDRLVEAEWIADAMKEIKTVWRALCSAHGVSTVPNQFGQCLTVTDAIQCPGRVVEDANTHLPRCSTCRRTYIGLDAVKLKIENEKTAA